MAHRILMDRKWLRLTLTLSLLWLANVQFGSPLFAQGQAPAFYQDQLPEDFPKKLASEGKVITDMVERGSTEYNSETVKQYFKSFLLPMLTQYQRPPVVNKAREDIRRWIEDNKLKTEQQKKDLADVVLEALKPVLSGTAPGQQRYHPSTRLVALGLIGQIDQKPVTQVGDKVEPAVPHATAFRDLGSIVMNASKEGPFADAFLIEALVGLERHARLGSNSWNPQMKAALGKKMVEYLVSPLPAPRDPEVHVYIQRRLLDCLVFFDTEDHKIARKFMIDQIYDKDANTYLRLQCVRNLYFPATCKDLSQEELEKLTVHVLHFVMHECKKWEESLNPAPAGMMGMGSAMGMGSGGGGGKGMGAPGGDIGLGSGSSSAGMEGSGSGGEGYGMMGMGSGSAGGMGGRTNPADQPVEVRFARRKLNMMIEYSRRGLDGAAKGKFQGETKNGLVAALGPQNPNIGEIRRLVEMLSVVHDLVNGAAIVPVPPGTTKKPDLNDKIPISTLATLQAALRRPAASSDYRTQIKSFSSVLEALNDFPGVKQLDEPEEEKVELAAADAKAVQ